jgi:tRNA A37 N6-isopentenylltransferase MiaA
MSEAERETEEGQKLFRESVLAMKIATRRYARRQVKWVNARFLSKIDRMVREFKSKLLTFSSNISKLLDCAPTIFLSAP